MSIEKTISDLTAAVTALTAAINAKSGAVVGAGTATVPQAPAPVAPVAQVPVFQAPAAQMPAPPSFTAPATQPSVVQQASAVPFSDGQGLIAYVMDAYKSMGPTKGAGIQGVLTSIGVANINDVKPEQYGTLYAGVEALKRG